MIYTCLFLSEREDPDTVVLEYHPIIPVDIRKYDPLPNDLPETKAVKEKYNLYSQKEIHYWKVRRGLVHVLYVSLQTLYLHVL